MKFSDRIVKLFMGDFMVGTTIGFEKIAKMTPMELKKIKSKGLVRSNSKGLTSKIYRFNQMECIKVFNNYQDEYQLIRYNMFANMNFSCAIMPKLLYLLNGRFKALKMNIVEGDELFDVDKQNLDYSKFVLLVNDLVNGIIDEISEEGIKIFDCHRGNIMYDYGKDKLFLIDQGEWTNNIYRPEEAKKENFSLINSAIFKFLFEGTYLHKTIRYGDDVVDYYESIKERAEKASKVKVKTVGDCVNAINMIGDFYD